MISLVLTVVFILLAVRFKSVIRKKSLVLYTVAIILSVFAFLFSAFPLFVPIQKGALGVSLFFVVMLTGAFKNKSKLRTSLMSVRKEYSILGFIFIIPHVLLRILQFLNNDINLPLYGLISFIIMIPLFITSFTVIRKKFSYNTWKNLQRFAYLSYLLLFIHLIVQSEMPNFIGYLLMLTIYLVLKAIYIFTNHKASEHSPT